MMGAAMDSQILVDQLGGSMWLVVLAGEHDLSTAPRLSQALADIERHGTDVLLDLSEATFIDSSILQTLFQHAGHPDERVAIVSPPGTMPRRLLELTRFDQHIRVCDTRTEGLLALGR
jgi:anti-anti-sigma factor